jgi:hypothetical protein
MIMRSGRLYKKMVVIHCCLPVSASGGDWHSRRDLKDRASRPDLTPSCLEIGLKGMAIQGVVPSLLSEAGEASIWKDVEAVEVGSMSYSEPD